MKFYTNGDSFIAGMECLGDSNRSNKNKEFSFPKILCEKLQCSQYINNAYNGASNDFIFNTSIADLIELKKTSDEEIFAVIGWSSLTRVACCIPSRSNEFIDYNVTFVNPMCQTPETKHILPLITTAFWGDQLLAMSQAARISAMHHFLKSNNIRHIFVNTCGRHDYNMLEHIPNFYTTDIFQQYVVNRYPQELRKEHHCSPIPHKMFGNMLFDFIVTNQL